jgi:methionine-gamma-lyase
MSDVSYAGASELANDFLPRLGVEVTRIDFSDLNAVQKALRPNTKLVYAETPCNPIIRLTDIRAVAEIAHSSHARLAVDSTFATPIATRPLELGADFVIHSLTKYLGGHGDAIGGVVVGKKADISKIRQGVEIHFGGIISPFNAWLIMRGMATLPIRMKAHAEGALKVAQYLESHSKVTQVIYPGLPSHPQHALALRQMANFSGMLTFQVPDADAATQLAKRLKIVHYAVSLGHHRSLVFYLSTADLLRTSFKLTAGQEASYRSYGGDGIFRMSVGLEDPEDIIKDLEQALS